MTEAVIVSVDCAIDDDDLHSNGWHRQWWLLLVGVVVAVSVGGLVLASQPPAYRARAALLVGSSLQSANPVPGAIEASAELARTYADLAGRPAFLGPLIEEMGLERSPERLAEQVTGRVQPGSQVVEIEAVDADPQAAQTIANVVAQALSRQAPEGDGVRQAAMSFAGQQLAELQKSITNLQSEISRREVMPASPEIPGMPPVEPDLATLRARLDEQRATYANLLRGYEEDGASNTLSIVQPAATSVPLGKPVLPVLAGAGLVGLLLAAAGIAVSQNMDTVLRWDRFGSATCLGLPVLGAIGNGSPKEGALCEAEEADRLRELAANLYLLVAHRDAGNRGRQAGGQDAGRTHTLLVTSPARQDGKTFVAANLGAALAATGAEVVVLDANLQHPTLHDALGVKNEPGLSEVLRGRRDVTPSTLRRIIRPAGRERLSLVTVGRDVMDCPLAWHTPRLRNLLQQLQGRFDFVVIDGPAIGSLAPDAGLLAALADQVILVVKSGATRREEARQMMRLLATRMGAEFAGVVFNRVQREGAASAEQAEPAEVLPQAKPAQQKKPRSTARPASRRTAREKAAAPAQPVAVARSTAKPRRTAKSKPAGSES